MSRRGLMQSTFAAIGSALASRPAVAAVGGPQKPQNIIWFFANGGWDVTYCLDPKLGTPNTVVEGPEWEETNGISPPGSNLRVTLPDTDIDVILNQYDRPKVGAFFGHVADPVSGLTNAQRTLVINGVWTGSIVHEGCRMRILTGNNYAAVPDLTCQIGNAFGGGLALGSVDMSGLGYAGKYAASTGRVGARSQIKSLLDPSSVFPAPDGSSYSLPTWLPSGYDDTGVSDRDRIDAYIRARAQILNANWAERGGDGVNLQRLADLEQSLERRQLLFDPSNVATLTDGLVVGTEPTLASQAQTAVNLIAGNLCRAVLISDMDSWDTHDTNALQNDRYNNFFGVLQDMIDDLVAANLLDSTLVVVASEMTRTPQHNWKGGKDHWAHTSMMLLGGGVTGGRQIGHTDQNLESMPVFLDTGVAPDLDGDENTLLVDGRQPTEGTELLKYDNLAAGILELFDIDPAETYPTINPLRALKV